MAMVMTAMTMHRNGEKSTSNGEGMLKMQQSSNNTTILVQHRHQEWFLSAASSPSSFILHSHLFFYKCTGNKYASLSVCVRMHGKTLNGDILHGYALAAATPQRVKSRQWIYYLGLEVKVRCYRGEREGNAA